MTAFSWQQGDDSKWTGNGRGRSWVARAGDYAAGLSASGRHDAVHIAAPLTRGSATGEGVNEPGRRQEDDVNLVAFHVTQDPISGTTSPAMSKGSRQGTSTIGVADGASVRRLTPRECERLQGFPDDWTQLGNTPDSRRYAALGDAVTVNVAEWIGRRLAAA